ncbi:MAG: hypothetical protein AB7U18_11460 [Dehalococcoidia bacterium]
MILVTRMTFPTMSEPIMNDEMRRARVEEIERAMETVLALAKLTEKPCDTPTSEVTADAGTLRVSDADSHYPATLRQGVEELGGRLEVTAAFPDRRMALIDEAGVITTQSVFENDNHQPHCHPERSEGSRPQTFFRDPSLRSG